MPTFGTVCDGIGCGHLAFNRAGFDCAWSFEIEAFPSAVLAYRFPDVKNHGDMLKCVGMIESGEIETPDVFIGGTPCQAFSVAGKRKGLEDARGNLSLTFCGIADAVDDVRGRDGKPPCVILWENVPGVLSDKGNAFGCFLGELSGSGCQLQPPGGKWGNAGCVFGSKRTVAWRTLDSQFFGVAQRRRRVFVVASAGEGARPEEILFEHEGLRRDSPPSREKRESFAADAGGGVALGHWDGGSVHPSLTQSHNVGGIGASSQELFSQRGAGLVPDICGCLSDGAHNGGGLTGQDAYTGRIIPVTYDMRGNGDGETPDARNKVQAIAIADVVHGDKGCNGKGWKDDGTAFTLDTTATQGEVIGFGAQMSTPQTDVNLMQTLQAQNPMAVAFERRFVRTSGGQPAVDIQPCLRADTNTGDGAPCVATQGVALSGDVACYDYLGTQGGGIEEGISPTLKKKDGVATVVNALQVRRLTPRECERLQALPDDWAKIPWRGKPIEECPDSPRYKAIGNGQTVTVMEWLARRIMAEMTR